MNKDTYRKRLYQGALDNHGLITTKMAVELGVPAVELRKLAQRSAIERIGQGVYRSPFSVINKTSIAMEALTLVGEGSFLYGQSVADYLELGDINPRQVQVGFAGRLRRTIPKHIQVIRATREDLRSIEIYDEVPCQGVEHTLAVLAKGLKRSTVEEMQTEALRRGLIKQLPQAEVAK